jgi:hypothetical protein
MRIQTYAQWSHRHIMSDDGSEVADFIDGLIAQMTYYPSYITQITPDAQGFLLAGKQRVVETTEQGDGMVALHTEGRDLWVTRADFQRLLAI